jgi:hypothetical protein
MSLYSLVLIVHVTAVPVLCAALSLEALSLFHLRRASTLAEGSRRGKLRDLAGVVAPSPFCYPGRTR